MHLSAMLSSLPLDFEPAVRQTAALGFPYVDVTALADRPPQDREVLADTGLLVCCAAIGRGLPEGHVLDAPSLEVRREALELMKRQLADAAGLGATHAYLVPGQDGSPAARRRFVEACGHLADFAAQRMVRLCVEHIPGRALPTVAEVLSLLDEAGNENLALLLDLGHCLITDEDPAAAVRLAGARLEHVHVDDNDGSRDLHWPLLTGKLTEPMLRTFLAALPAIGYQGAITLELSPKNPEPVQALRQGKALLERLAEDR